MPDNIAEIYHTERSTPKNVRYINYNLLRAVEFQGEPVVPKILGEEKDEIGSFFKVEKLNGLDLGDFLHLPDVDIKTKLKVIKHVISQLQAIDESGFVLFDRNGGNVRVLEWKENISTRQIDIEDIYDKSADAVYSLDGQKGYEDMIDALSEKDIDIWAPAVNKIAQGVGGILKDFPGVSHILSPYEDIRTLPSRQKILTEFSKAIDLATNELPGLVTDH
ncbi:hypothetical protein A2188_02785 [Candidatus Woesebacteria bacterium RIFOXYA1_FULL_43_9]|uniref:Uncharacterized protein n=1 Tax=Candidatus Woesebacteria bacterium RIFOXYA1_FULL_43_9 TaxID=1802534 RepID=A0A1F8CQ90_9BACT|nr:MAG: hypothetical protein A2188_02785 [Candidatus Woesebacteria bacterium RIFOXYA1_FULL_43_9]